VGVNQPGFIKGPWGGKTLSCHFRWYEIIFFYENSSLEFSQTPGPDAELKKESIALFFMI